MFIQGLGFKPGPPPEPQLAPVRVQQVYCCLRVFQVATGVLDLEHTVTDVIEGKEYLFSVTACNKCGSGEPAYIDEPVNVSSPASQCSFCPPAFIKGDLKFSSDVNLYGFIFSSCS